MENHVTHVTAWTVIRNIIGLIYRSLARKLWERGIPGGIISIWKEIMSKSATINKQPWKKWGKYEEMGMFDPKILPEE